MKRILPAIAVLLLAAGLAAWWLDVPARLGWGGSGEGPLVLYGNVDIREVRLGFRVGGRIAEMAFEEGDAVDAGAVLARLDPRPYEDAAAAAAARAAVERATLDRLEAGPRPAEIEQARATLAEREAALENARRELERARRLRPADTISQSGLDLAQAESAMAAARVDAARSALRLLEEGTRKEELAAARAELAAAEAELATAKGDLDDTTLRAPAGGIALSRLREPGAIVAAGDAVYTLSLVRPVRVRAYVAEPDLGRIHPGMAVEVVTDTAPGRPYHGRIGFISPVAEFTPKTVETEELRTDLVYRLRVTVEDADEGLRQGMPVTVRAPRTAPGDGGG